VSDDGPRLALPPWLTQFPPRILRRALIRTLTLGLCATLTLGFLGGWPRGIALGCAAWVLFPLTLAESRPKGEASAWHLYGIVAGVAALGVGLAVVQAHYLTSVFATLRVDTALLDTGSWLPSYVRTRWQAPVTLWVLAATVLGACHVGRHSGANGSHVGRPSGTVPWEQVSDELKGIATFVGCGGSLLLALVIGLSSPIGNLIDFLLQASLGGLCLGIGLVVFSYPLALGLHWILAFVDALEERVWKPKS
jgi:hypothetical protein